MVASRERWDWVPVFKMAKIRSNFSFRQCQRLQRCLGKKFSTSNSAAKASPAVATNQTQDLVSQNPEDHSTKDLGKFYTVPEKTVTSLFSCGIPKPRFLEEVKTIGDFNIMVRQPALSILENIKVGDSSPTKFVIYGQDGCGKTITLSHILHYCFHKQWCITLIPSVFRIVHSKHSVLRSSYNDERFDQPEEALSWLKTFQLINEKHLPQITTTKEYKVGQKISIDSGKPITTVINQAFHRPNFATDAVGITLREMQNISDKFPVLFAADDFNGLFWRTSLKDPETREWLEPRDLSLVRFFEKLFHPQSSIKRGSYAMALSRTGMERSSCSSYNHMQLLRQKGMSSVGPYEAIEVTEYTDEELMQCLQYYQHKGLLTKDVNDRKTYQEIAFLTNRRPSLVRKMCLSF